MKRSEKPGRRVGYFAFTVPIIILVAVSIIYGTGIDNIALFCAGVMMPEGSVSVIGERLKAPSEEEEKAETDVQTFQEPKEIEPEEAETASKTVDLTATPADIAALIAQAKIDHAKDKKDGKIVSKTYSKKESTSAYGRVTVRNTTDTKSLNIEKVLANKPELSIDKSKPAVLIFHTHSTEGYELLERDWYASDYSSRTKDISKNVVRVGTEITKQLENAGFSVIHDTAIHDTSYNGSYGRSRKSIEKILKENPQIEVVLDVHRDAIHQSNGNKIKPVAEINGKKTAQIMIITGAEEGKVTDFPNWEHNLRFALQLQNTAEKLYPGLMRPVFFSQRKYNMDITKCSLLLEMGSDVNTLDEAAYAGRLIGSSLAEMLNEYVK